MSRSYAPSLSGWGRVTLEELNERAALLDREENKYLLRADRFAPVLSQLRDTFDVLAIDGRTAFGYETTYYDTAALTTYRQHAQGKRLRYKIRSRRYLDSDLCFFEVKLKGQRGRTVKERLPYSERRHGLVDPDARRFVDRCLRLRYGDAPTGALAASLTMRYRRLTLVSRERPERVTIDFDLRFATPGTGPVAAPTDLLIIEVKTDNGHGITDRLLTGAGIRPAACSKYCVGLNLVRGDLPYNAFKQPLTRHFNWLAPAIDGAGQ